MKKKCFTLILSLLLAMNTAACGTQSTAGNGTDQSTVNDSAADNSGQNGIDSVTDPSGLNTPSGGDTSSSGLNMPAGIGSDGSGFSTSIGSGLDFSGLADLDESALAFSSLTDFCNSEFVSQMEEALNEIFTEAFGMRIFFTAQEPDTLIFNYQFLFSLSSLGLSQEEAAQAFASGFQETDSAEMTEFLNNMKILQAYGLPVTVTRLNYLDAEGALLYSMDVTEDGGITGAPDSSGTPDNPGMPGNSVTAPGLYRDLQDWMDSSEDAALTVESTNQSLTSTGITFDLAVDGSILIYQYYLPDDYFADGLAEEDLTASFDTMVDAGSASVDAIISMFMDKYGLTVDAVRFAYYAKDGTELYTRDVRP